jgi:hypothetical protein
VATSLHARLLRPPPPEVLGSVMLIRCRKSPGAFYRGPEFLPQVDERRDGQIGGEILPARANHRVEK